MQKSVKKSKLPLLLGIVLIILASISAAYLKRCDLRLVQCSSPTVKKAEEPTAVRTETTSSSFKENVIDTFQDESSWKTTDKNKQDNKITVDTNDHSFGKQSMVLNSYTKPLKSTDATTEPVMIEKMGPIDLSASTLLLTFKVENVKNAKDLSIYFSNDNWKSSAAIDLRSSYRPEFDGEWITSNFGKGMKRENEGYWRVTSDSFDWGKIDGVRFKVSSYANESVKLKLNKMFSYDAPKEGKIIIVFDDGYQSIKPATETMIRLGLKGNVGVIGQRVEEGSKGYLTMDQLKDLQNNAGWNLVNHSYFHKNGLEEYASKNRFDDYEQDILRGRDFLAENNMNSAPHWYIFPNGANNAKLREIIGKYYKFARTSAAQPESYPFGNPLMVKTYAVENVTPVASVQATIDDTKAYHLTTFLTFHRILSTPDDPPGYPIADFNKIMEYIASQNVKVVTLGEFDKENGL